MKDFSYSSFHKDSTLNLGQEMRTELEIEETLLNEGVAMNCEGQIVVEGEDQEEFWEAAKDQHKKKKKKTLVASLPRSAAAARKDIGNTSSSDEDMEHYFDFSRTIVSHSRSKDLAKCPSPPSSRTLAQLDGVDDGTESDASIVTNDDAQKVAQNAKNPKNKKFTGFQTANCTNAVHSPVPEASSSDKHKDSNPYGAREDSKKDLLSVDNKGFVSSQFSADQSSCVNLPTIPPTPVDPSPANTAGNSKGVLQDLLKPPSISTEVQAPSHGLMDSMQMFSQSSLTSITLQPVTCSQECATFSSPSTKLTTLTPVGDLTQPLSNVFLQNDPVLSASSGTLPSVETVPGTIYSSDAQALVSTAVPIVSSSASLSELSTPTAAPPAVQTTTTPVILNGYSSSSVQKDTASGHTISINFSTPRPALEPQLLAPQALSGHAILTVKEVGGPNVDPTPHVLLVNRLGQIFVKNPESNTFQLPTPNSSSYNCVTQIASLLQSNALSATLAAAGNMSVQTPVANVVQGAAPPVAPVEQNPTTIMQLLTHNSNGAVASVNVKKPKKNTKASKDETALELKKPKKKKESSAPKKSKSSKAAGSAAVSTPKPPVTPAESAQAIIYQAMASNYTPKYSGIRSLSPSSLVLPPGLLIEPEELENLKCPRSPSPPPPPAPPPALPAPSVSAPRPRTHVRMKRVSSLSDRIVTKKSKVDFLKPEPIHEQEEQQQPAPAPAPPQRHKVTPQSVSSRASGVRIKTPTVKGILNLDEVKEEHMSDSDSTG